MHAMSLQPFTVWSQDFSTTENMALPNGVDVFEFHAPSLVDIIEATGGRLEARLNWHVWRSSPSDVEGCVHLDSPQLLRPSSKLSDANVPVLALVDQLYSLGFTDVLRLCTHTAGDAKIFDARRLPSKRCYLQCVLALQDLLAAGVPSFKSNKSQWFYKVLLKTKHCHQRA